MEELRKAGAKYIFLKTGAYRPADLARALVLSARYKLDLLTVDGAGGGTGMSPWRMMNEWGVPPVELHSLLYQYARQPRRKGVNLPALAVAGGFTFEDQIFKGLAMGAPFVKLVGMARAPIAAAMVGKTIGRAIEENQLPVYVERFGRTKDEIFVTATPLRKELGDEEFEKVPTGRARPAHLLRAPGPGTAPAHGRKPQVLGRTYFPQRPGRLDPGSGGDQRYSDRARN